jgi:molybdenum cofactor guanylyltransferase
LRLSAIILAGGRSSRIGFNKLEIKIENVPLLIDLIIKLKFFCEEILISASKKNMPLILSEIEKIDAYKKEYDFEKTEMGNQLECFCAKDIKIVLDDADKKNIGPIMGLYKGLSACSHPYAVVTAFDMPFISYGLLHFLIFKKNREKKETQRKETAFKDTKTALDKDARICKTEKGFEALCGLYSKSCLDAIEKKIHQKNYKISDFFDLIDMDIIDSKEMAFHHIDLLNFFNINKTKDYRIFKDLWQKEIDKISSDIFAKVWSSFFFR